MFTEMALQVQFVCLLRWFSLLLIASMSVNGQTTTLSTMPPRYAIQGQSVEFDCRSSTTKPPAGASITWYMNGTNLMPSERYLISDDRLIINNTMLVDSGMYSCRFMNASIEGRLDVLPPSWRPVCGKEPRTGSLTTGSQYMFRCTSTGHVNTSLELMIVTDGSVHTGDKVKRSGTTVSSSHNGTVTDSTSSLVFTCEVQLGSLTEDCFENFQIRKDNQSPIALVVVGLMSLIALLLFCLVLFFVFRHRQCRFCREPMLEPQQILDANSLQTGAWIPPPVVAIDVDVSDDGESVGGAHHLPSDLESVSLPPDVVPAQDPRDDFPPEMDVPVGAPAEQPEPENVLAVEAALVATSSSKPKHKKKNLTITKNINQNVDKPTQALEKKAVPLAVPPSGNKPRPTQKSEKKPIKRYGKSPVKARLKQPKEPIYAQVKKLNVPSIPVSSKPADDAPYTSTGAETSPAQPPTPPPRPASEDFDSKDASSIATVETDSTDQITQLENDLGRGNSKKKRPRHYRKKSEETQRTPDQSDSVLNIQATDEEPPKESTQSPEESSGTSKKKTEDKIPADRVIYAELDFSKDVGLNILE